MKNYQQSLFVFRRDLRLTDNKALAAALAQSEHVACLFIVDPIFTQPVVTREFAKAFLLSALQALNAELNTKHASLWIAYGKVNNCIEELLFCHDFDALFINKEYTPAEIRRDQSLADICQSQSIDMHGYDDALLFPPGMVLKKDGKPYSVFTPFYRAACQLSVESKVTIHKACGSYLKAPKTYAFSILKLEEEWQVTADAYDVETMRESLLDELLQFQHYDEERDFPSMEATTGLSVHLASGTISVRQAYHAIRDTLGVDSPLLRQLYWRDFFNHIAYFFPHVLTSSFRQQYDQISWDNNIEQFEVWKKGQTGFPIVDAGMRQLNETGYMHNRVRMVVASFLVKDLHIDWRWGEQYFKEKLIDYDPALNNGNWQWAASTGCDAQPYFRIFNPWRQQLRFDANCDYIYRWVPELRGVPVKTLHHLYKHNTSLQGYYSPVVDHAEQSAVAKLLFKQISQGTAEV